MGIFRDALFNSKCRGWVIFRWVADGVHIWMVGWVFDGWVGFGWMHGWMDGVRIDGWINGWVLGGCMNGWVDWMDEWMVLDG